MIKIRFKTNDDKTKALGYLFREVSGASWSVARLNRQDTSSDVFTVTEDHAEALRKNKIEFEYV